MAHFTDEVYLYQEDLLEHGFAASYDPAILRAQAWTARLAYTQALQSYVYAWKQLVAAVGLRQLPLTEVAGRVDALIPYYDYDAVLAHVLQNHTDVLTARNGIDAAKYNLKLAQITPYPDVDFAVSVTKDFAVPPQQVTPTVTVGVPIPIWDQNKGNIRSAEAALVRALEEPHRVELNLTNTLATNYANYKNNLAALESYRKDILPDQVRAFRGVDERRRFDINALSLTDLATAQQNLSTSVTTYLGILSSLWTSTVSVADLLETDDLFQLAEPQRTAAAARSGAPGAAAVPPPVRPDAGRRRPRSGSMAARRPHISCCPRRQSRPVRLSFVRPPRRLLPWTRLPHSNATQGDPAGPTLEPLGEPPPLQHLAVRGRRSSERLRPLAISETLGSLCPRRGSEYDAIRRAAAPAAKGRNSSWPARPFFWRRWQSSQGRLSRRKVMHSSPTSPPASPPALPPQAADGTEGSDAGEYNPLPGLPRPPDQPRSLLAPATAPLYEPAALPGPYFERDPLLDPPELPPPGWFADVDVLAAKAHVKNKLTNASIPGGAPRRRQPAERPAELDRRPPL